MVERRFRRHRSRLVHQLEAALELEAHDGASAIMAVAALDADSHHGSQLRALGKQMVQVWTIG